MSISCWQSLPTRLAKIGLQGMPSSPEDRRCAVNLAISFRFFLETSSTRHGSTVNSHELRLPEAVDSHDPQKYGGGAYSLLQLTVRKQECSQPAKTTDCEMAARFLMG